MSRSEFRWNKKRKHYAYLHRRIGTRCFNILITSKPNMLRNGKIEIKNTSLYKHPNPKKEGKYYLVPRNYFDELSSFDNKVYAWKWDVNDKRKVKRIKKNKYK